MLPNYWYENSVVPDLLPQATVGLLEMGGDRGIGDRGMGDGVDALLGMRGPFVRVEENAVPIAKVTGSAELQQGEETRIGLFQFGDKWFIGVEMYTDQNTSVVVFVYDFQSVHYASGEMDAGVQAYEKWSSVNGGTSYYENGRVVHPIWYNDTSLIGKTVKIAQHNGTRRTKIKKNQIGVILGKMPPSEYNFRKNPYIVGYRHENDIRSIMVEIPGMQFGSTDSASLADAVKYKDHVMVKTLLSRGEDPDELPNEGPALLYVAAGQGDLDMVNALLEYGASPNGLANEGLTPLFAAVEGGHLDVVQTLVKSGATKNVFKGDDNLLSIAMTKHMEHPLRDKKRKYLEIVKYLMGDLIHNYTIYNIELLKKIEFKY